MSNPDPFYPFFTTIRLNLLVCKYLGMCSILNIFSSSNSKTLEWKVLSFGNLYVIIFCVFCQYITGGVTSFTERKDFRGLKSCLHVLQSILNTISDKRLLEVLRNAEDVDELIKPFLAEEKHLLSSFGYKWLLLIFTFDIYIFYHINCNTGIKNCVFNFQNILVFVYYHLSFLSMVSLFCTIASELAKRFRVLRLVIGRNRRSCDDPQFLEDCRMIHTKLTVASEGFRECFSARVTNQLLVLALHMVTNYCSACFYGEGCEAFSFIQKMLQQLTLVCTICYCAHKLDEEVSFRTKIKLLWHTISS